METETRVLIFHTSRADHECDCHRRVAWHRRYTVDAEEQTLFFKWTSKDEHGKVAKFAEWRFFAVLPSPNWQNNGMMAHSVGKLNRADERSLVINGSTHSVGPGGKQVRDEKLNLDSVKAVLSRIGALKMSTAINAPVARQEYSTNPALDEHKCTPFCTRCAWDTGVRCRTRFENIWTREFAEAEVAHHAVDTVPIDQT